MRFCLDTSAYSHFKRGDPQVVELIDRADWLGVPVVVLGELAVGFRQGSRRKEHESDLAEFLANPVVEVLPVDEDMVGIYADVVTDLKKAGTPLPANDIWIATVATRHGATVLTYDQHFRLIARTGSTVLTAPTDHGY
ncbi:MAG: type II toxin-antitoxin system VapC family toxin [Acidobacteriota bacterium]|nr:type II toxin-antitoxin system VapC family toxin [Acidobacteriota bacterium]